MKDVTYKIIKATVDGDETMTAEARLDLLAYCKTPRTSQTNSTPITPTTFVTPKIVAKNLSVTLRTVQHWISLGLLPSRKIEGCRRIPLDAYEKFTAQH